MGMCLMRCERMVGEVEWLLGLRSTPPCGVSWPLSPEQWPECIATCVPDAKLSKALEAKPLLHLGNPCQMKKEIGNCRAMMPHYYFDVKLQVCKLFFYGGCGGNSNRYYMNCYVI